MWHWISEKCHERCQPLFTILELKTVLIMPVARTFGVTMWQESTTKNFDNVTECHTFAIFLRWPKRTQMHLTTEIAVNTEIGQAMGGTDAHSDSASYGCAESKRESMVRSNWSPSIILAQSVFFSP